MCAVYTATCVIAYATRGEQVHQFLPDSLERGPAKTAVGVLLFFHICISYIITGQPLYSKVHQRTFPQSFGLDSTETRMHWLMITVFFLVFAFLIANVVPFFSAFQNVLGSLCGGPSMFGWPALFFIMAHRNLHRTIPMVDRVMCAFFLCCLLPLCTSLGFISAMRDLLHDWDTYGKPFQCYLAGY